MIFVNIYLAISIRIALHCLARVSWRESGATSALHSAAWAGQREHGNQFQHKTPDLRHTIHAVSVLEGVEQWRSGAVPPWSMMEADLCPDTEAKCGLASMQQRVAQLEAEVARYKRIIVMQQECLFRHRDFQQFQKCSFCHKIFVNSSFLCSHMARRHPEQLKGEDEVKERSGTQSHQSTQTQEEASSPLEEASSPLALGHSDQEREESRRSASWPSLATTATLESPAARHQPHKHSLKRKLTSIGRKLNRSFRTLSLKRK